MNRLATFIGEDETFSDHLVRLYRVLSSFRKKRYQSLTLPVALFRMGGRKLQKFGLDVSSPEVRNLGNISRLLNAH